MTVAKVIVGRHQRRRNSQVPRKSVDHYDTTKLVPASISIVLNRLWFPVTG